MLRFAFRIFFAGTSLLFGLPSFWDELKLKLLFALRLLLLGRVEGGTKGITKFNKAFTHIHFLVILHG